MNRPYLIVMLTQNDLTVDNAYEIFEQCKDSKAEYWGFKEEGIDFHEMKKLSARIKECGKIAVLEAVVYSKEKAIAAAELAAACQCDILMGTVFFQEVSTICTEHNIKYLPFVGDVRGRPSSLFGNIDDMINHAEQYIKKGALGIDLLSYRYNGSCKELNRKFIEKISSPVCIAGSIDSIGKLDEIKKLTPWAFTIGSAFFENKFGGSFADQIDFVLDYINNQN